MCSDFSLKALLTEWSEEHLGPNPFKKCGTCSSQFQIAFLPPELQNGEVPQQLQVVGELCAEQGKAVVAAMSDTILYTVNPNRTPTQVYDLKILTVVTESAGGEVAALPEAMKCSIGVPGQSEKRGTAGHTTLTYASGGQLITSTGHWIELTRIDTSADAVLQVAGKNFGAEERCKIQTELDCVTSDAERHEVVQRWAKEHVSKSVPTRMCKRTKF